MDKHISIPSPFFNTMIEIHLYGLLRKYATQKSPLKESVLYLETGGDESIQSIVNRLEIPPEELGPTLFLNGEYSGIDRRVKDGDRIGLFPPNMILAYRQYFEKVEE
jgi:molybdopterin converting factor small subunit